MSKSIAERIEALRARAVKSLGPLGLLASGLLLFGVGIAADGIAAFALYKNKLSGRIPPE